MNAQFHVNLVSNLYENDSKFLSRIVVSCKNAELLRKRIYCFVETLITSRDMIFNWYSYNFYYYCQECQPLVHFKNKEIGTIVHDNKNFAKYLTL